ncbi:hypothetical protein Pcinc_041728 [Petrolisthes cinctipes]|uniref:Uncharacterized protein n=1 Tax=Petrolisthes cinctipes TaxID=88211 RepID=A0AAE1EI25_PETCI|nr:hypothetical protein Pcinc_041728 [Petrolisthes cinctipes]
MESGRVRGRILGVGEWADEYWEWASGRTNIGSGRVGGQVLESGRTNNGEWASEGTNIGSGSNDGRYTREAPGSSDH